MKRINFEQVPDNIRIPTEAILLRFAICGICDPLYIANVIAYENGVGDGECDFWGGELTKIDAAAQRIQSAYGCNIMPFELNELKDIIQTGKICNNIAIPRMEASILRMREEIQKVQTSDPWRAEYLQKEIESVKKNIEILRKE